MKHINSQTWFYTDSRKSVKLQQPAHRERIHTIINNDSVLMFVQVWGFKKKQNSNVLMELS